MFSRYEQPNDMQVHVAGLHKDVTDDMLFSYFSKFGVVVHAKVKKNIITNESRGFGFVVFENSYHCKTMEEFDKIRLFSDKVSKKIGLNALKSSGKESIMGQKLTISPKGATKIVYLLFYPMNLDFKQLTLACTQNGIAAPVSMQKLNSKPNNKASEGLRKEKIELRFDSQDQANDFCRVFSKIRINGSNFICKLKFFGKKVKKAVKKHQETNYQFISENVSIRVSGLKNFTFEDISHEIEWPNYVKLQRDRSPRAICLCFESLTRLQQFFKRENDQLFISSKKLFEDGKDLRAHSEMNEELVKALKNQKSREKDEMMFNRRKRKEKNGVESFRNNMRTGNYQQTPEFSNLPPVYYPSESFERNWHAHSERAHQDFLEFGESHKTSLLSLFKGTENNRQSNSFFSNSMGLEKSQVGQEAIQGNQNGHYHSKMNSEEFHQRNTFDYYDNTFTSDYTWHPNPLYDPNGPRSYQNEPRNYPNEPRSYQKEFNDFFLQKDSRSLFKSTRDFYPLGSNENDEHEPSSPLLSKQPPGIIPKKGETELPLVSSFLQKNLQGGLLELEERKFEIDILSRNEKENIFRRLLEEKISKFEKEKGTHAVSQKILDLVGGSVFKFLDLVSEKNEDSLKRLLVEFQEN